MSPPDSPDDDVDYLTERVETQLEKRPDVLSFSVEPDETVGVLVTVETTDGMEHHHVTLETTPEGEENVHWALLGEDPRT